MGKEKDGMETFVRWNFVPPVVRKRKGCCRRGVVGCEGAVNR